MELCAGRLKEVPGKEWMRAVYASNGFEFSEDEWADVWRLEPRFGGAWLKERNIRHTAELLRFFPELITEAIFSRRLAVRTKDSNRGRWPLHPLWTAAYQARGAPAMRPVGFHPTERKSKLLRSMLLNVAGGVRSLAVLQDGKFDRETAQDVLSQALEIIEGDPEHEAKVKKLLERYRFVDEMG